MHKPSFTKQFERDLRRIQKRGKESSKIKVVMALLIEEQALPERYRDHRLVGNYRGRRECHIEADWLLIYKRMDDEIVFERTGCTRQAFPRLPTPA